jgi:hypothetical protein
MEKGLAFGKAERRRWSQKLGEEKEGDEYPAHRSESRGAGAEHCHDGLEWIAELLKKVDVLHESVGKIVEQCTVKG